MRPIVYSRHSLDQMPDRGVTEQEVEEAIRDGDRLPAKLGRWAFRKNFPFEAEWKGRYYAIKQVMPVVVEEPSRIVVVTVYSFFFGGGEG